MKGFNKLNTGKFLKTIIFTLLLIITSCFFGIICHRIGELGDAIFSPTLETLYLFLWLLLALALVAVTAGVVAVLLRPFWVCVVAFALSGLAMLLVWEFSLLSSVVVALYFLAGLLYSRGVAKGLEERIKFSVQPISDNQTILLLVLVIVICVSFYLGYARQIEREGFSTPPFITDRVVRMANPEPDEKEKFIAEFEKGVENAIRPYEQFIPIGIAIALFFLLRTVIGIFSWVPVLFLRILFSILTCLQVTKMVTETREVKRLTI